MGTALCASREQGETVEETGIQFDVKKSTEDNWGIPHFTGRYAELRPLLDYTYHRMYHPKRIQVQDELIAKFSKPEENEEPLLPWVVFTAGAMGAGKGYVRDWMTKNGYWPIERFVIVDPDAVRQNLPEWPQYVAADSEKAGDMTQKEAGMIAELIGFAGLRDRRNVVFDGSLRDVKWYKSYFHRLRQNFPGIRIMIIHIIADRDTVLKRAEERGKKTGRVVPRETLIESMEATPISVQTLSHLADFTVRVENRTDAEPAVVREPGAPHPPESIPMSWDLFKTLWMNPDTDGDGILSKEEIHHAISLGLLTSDVLKSVDSTGDGRVSKEDLRKAKETAAKNAGIKFK